MEPRVSPNGEDEKAAPPAEDEKKDEENGGDEAIYVGNLWKSAEGQVQFKPEGKKRNVHHWTLFLSTAPDKVVAPKTVASVKWKLHPTFVPSECTRNVSPFLLSRMGWGTFDPEVTITFKESANRKTIFMDYPIQFGASLQTIRADNAESLRKRPVALRRNKKLFTVMKELDVNKMLAEFNSTRGKRKKAKKGPGAGEDFMDKTMGRLERNLLRMTPPLQCEDFILSAETLVKTFSEFSRASKLLIPQEILQLLVLFSVPRKLRCRNTQAVVFKNCRDLDLRLIGKSKQVFVSGCQDLQIELDDAINFCELYKSERIFVRASGRTGVPTYKTEDCKDVTIAFDEAHGFGAEDIVTFINQGDDRGDVSAAAFSNEEKDVAFERLPRKCKLPAYNHVAKFSKGQGWTFRRLTNRMRGGVN